MATGPAGRGGWEGRYTVLRLTASAKAAGNPEYLTVAEALAEYCLKQVAENDAMVPFRDFDDPEISGTPRDSSAAAIVASARRDMAAIHTESVQKRRWQSSVVEMRD